MFEIYQSHAVSVENNAYGLTVSGEFGLKGRKSLYNFHTVEIFRIGLNLLSNFKPINRQDLQRYQSIKLVFNFQKCFNQTNKTRKIERGLQRFAIFVAQ